MLKFIWLNIVLMGLLNWFVAPVAYLFRKQAQRNKGFLWWFLSDGNMYGDVTWRSNLKNKHLRALLWMYRNPLQNYYWRNFVDGVETDFHGTLKYKFTADFSRWRTVVCSDTGDWHGKIIDFHASPFGVQNIVFKRTDKNGKVQKCYRKSTCYPIHVFRWIILIKRRSGHESGLMQYNFTFPKFNYKINKAGFETWKKETYKKMVL